MSEESRFETRIKRIEEAIVFLSKQKCNAGPFQWLNHRVGQIERRLDRALDDNWEGDLSPNV